MAQPDPTPENSAQPLTATAPAAAVAGNTEGVVSLLVAGLLGWYLSILARPRALTGDGVTEGVILLALYAGAWLFAISGFRRGACLGRIAAAFTLGLLTATVLFLLGAAIIGAAR